MFPDRGLDGNRGKAEAKARAWACYGRYTYVCRNSELAIQKRAELDWLYGA
jgi:hypothetical protein